MQITWQIEWMKTTPDTAIPPNCVMLCGWRCTGVDDTHQASVYGSAGFAAPGNPFVPYADLTQDQVLGWVWANGVDKAATEASIQKQLDDQINPPIIQPPLPWSV